MSHRQLLCAEEVKQAIFVDYEGNIDKPPTLLGWRVDGKTHAAIVEPAFSVCSNRYRAKNVDLADHSVLASRLIALAEQESRKIVSWSEHDFKVMSKELSESQRGSFCTVYRNAIRTARSWHYSTMGHSVKEASLACFSELLGFSVPVRYGSGVVGQGLRLIRQQIEEGRTYAELTPRGRASWVAIVKHNRLDLAAMEHILLSIAA
jgi:hypothetical protein